MWIDQMLEKEETADPGVPAGDPAQETTPEGVKGYPESNIAHGLRVLNE
jgi:hypothetical protein